MPKIHCVAAAIQSLHEMSETVMSTPIIIITGRIISSTVRTRSTGKLYMIPQCIPGAGSAMPPEEIIDFILDRPFLFVIATYEGVPLFTGVVNEP